MKISRLGKAAFLSSVLACSIGASVDAPAQEIINPCKVNSGTSDYPPNLQRYDYGQFRVFYTMVGSDAVADITDANANGVPDYVENVARQADFSLKALTFVGFRSPFESSRYRAVKYIDIGIKDLGQYNGLAYDEIWRHPNIPLKANECTLLIDLSRSLANFPGNGWPLVTHELFHLFTNSYTMFKPLWFKEASAKWAEYVIRTGWSTSAVPAPLPATMAQMQAVFAQDYPMEFWNRLIQIMDASTTNTIYLPTHLTSATYVDGTVIMKDNIWRGIGLFLSLHQAMDAEDDIVSGINGWGQYDWLESDQKNPAHDLRLLKLLQRVVRQSGISTAEVNAFLAIQ